MGRGLTVSADDNTFERRSEGIVLPTRDNLEIAQAEAAQIESLNDAQYLKVYGTTSGAAARAEPVAPVETSAFARAMRL